MNTARSSMRADTTWFHDAGWGVFFHYLTTPETSADDWNRRVDGFDTALFASQLAAVKAPYCFFTIGQNSGHFCAPNTTYDGYVQRFPSLLSRCDIIADLYSALAAYGISLLVYLPAGAPAWDNQAMERLEWRWGLSKPWPDGGGEPTHERLVSFQLRWELVIAEWSRRWGSHVRGWWFDGCYFSDAMYRSPDPPNFFSFAGAAKAGNSQSLVAFNPGVFTPVRTLTPAEDYTAGEIAEAFPTCPGRWVDGAQYHVLSYLGERWSGGEPRLSTDLAVAYTTYLSARGGVMTWDLPVADNGLIGLSYMRQLTVIGAAMSK
ncbi:MAG: alpha-L-fucosidase [Anaerolineae bacterium]